MIWTCFRSVTAGSLTGSLFVRKDFESGNLKLHTVKPLNIVMADTTYRTPLRCCRSHFSSESMESRPLILDMQLLRVERQPIWLPAARIWVLILANDSQPFKDRRAENSAQKLGEQSITLSQIFRVKIRNLVSGIFDLILLDAPAVCKVWFRLTPIRCAR